MGDRVAGDKIVIHGQVGAAGRHATAAGNSFGQGVGPGGSSPSGGDWRVGWIVIAAVLLVVLALLVLRPWDPAPAGDSIYRLRVTVLDPQGRPLEGGELHASVGGELQKIDGGWELEIPAAKRPADGLIELRATERTGFLEASTVHQLVEGDFEQALTLRLEVPTDAQISGRVFDRDGRPVAGARVSGDRGPASATTDESGYFTLPANAARGQMVKLHAEKTGVGRVDQSHPAGDHPVELVLR